MPVLHDARDAPRDPDDGVRALPPLSDLRLHLDSQPHQTGVNHDRLGFATVARQDELSGPVVRNIVSRTLVTSAHGWNELAKRRDSRYEPGKPGGLLWHPEFVGVRADKNPRDVTGSHDAVGQTCRFEGGSWSLAPNLRGSALEW